MSFVRSCTRTTYGKGLNNILLQARYNNQGHGTAFCLRPSRARLLLSVIVMFRFVQEDEEESDKPDYRYQTYYCKDSDEYI